MESYEAWGAVLSNVNGSLEAGLAGLAGIQRSGLACLASCNQDGRLDAEKLSRLFPNKLSKLGPPGRRRWGTGANGTWRLATAQRQ